MTSHATLAGSAQGRSARAGATLFYGPGCRRPDMMRLACDLVDDLTAEGQVPVGLRVDPHTLRLRLAGAELTLALSGAPLPSGALIGLRRPAPRPDERADSDDAARAQALLTDIATIRVMRKLHRHSHALGVLVRLNGACGEPAALLRLALDSLLGSVPPALVLWHPSGLVLTPCEWAASGLDRPAGPVLPATPPVPAEGTSRRAARAARRSAGRVFGRDPALRHQRPAAPTIRLPRAEAAQMALATAWRAPEPLAKGPPGRVLRRLMLGLWFAAVLPSWSGLMSVLAF